MSVSIPQYWFTEAFNAETLSAVLGDAYQFSVTASKPLRLTYLDSFDWRLHAIGQIVRYEWVGREKKLSLLSRTEGLLDLRKEVAIPVFSRDFPAHLAWKNATRALDIRALVPQIELLGEQMDLRILNSDQKTVVRGELEWLKVKQKSGQVALRPRLTLLPVLGYQNDLEKLCAKIDQTTYLFEDKEDLVDLSLRLLGRAAGDYSSKVTTRLQAKQTAEAATRQILSELFAVLEANVDGTKSDIDIEFLHDLRVACRRTRSALSQIKAVLPAEKVAAFKARFAWLQQVTGPTRDYDVFLQTLPSYRATLPQAMQTDLDPFKTFLQDKRDKAQRTLKRNLAGKQFAQLRLDWAAFLADSQAENHAANAKRSIEIVAQERIWKMYRRVLKEGSAISEESPDEDLHELRKSCKKLRYLIEFFQSLFSTEPVKAQVKALKGLLDCLGDFQDLVVQAEKLQAFGEQMQRENLAPLATVLALGAVVADLHQRQQQAQHDFSSLFAQFASPANQATMRTLFQSKQLSTTA